MLRFLYSNPDSEYTLLEDICGADYPERENRFEVVYHLYSLKTGRHIRLKVAVGGENPTLPTAIGVYKAADWFEREAFDQYGIRFEGHPNLRRLIMPVPILALGTRIHLATKRPFIAFFPFWVDSVMSQEYLTV